MPHSPLALEIALSLPFVERTSFRKPIKLHNKFNILRKWFNLMEYGWWDDTRSVGCQFELFLARFIDLVF